MRRNLKKCTLFHGTITGPSPLCSPRILKLVHFSGIGYWINQCSQKTINNIPHELRVSRNMPEESIKKILAGWLENIEEPPQGLKQQAHQVGLVIPFDCKATLAGKSFYIEIKRTFNLNTDSMHTMLHNMSELVRLRLIEQAPLLIAISNGNDCQIGYAIFWDFDKCYWNKNIGRCRCFRKNS